jgi:hypothetical protein
MIRKFNQTVVRTPKNAVFMLIDRRQSQPVACCCSRTDPTVEPAHPILQGA